MRDPLILRKSFMAGTKNDPRDVAAVTEALRATGFLPCPVGGGPAGGGPAGGGPTGGVVPSEAEVGDALRRFQDREGLVVDGYAALRGPTEGELRKAGKRAAELAARPKRTGPIRFEALTADNYRESRGMAKGVVRRTDHRGAIVLMRRAMEDNPAALPELIQLAEQVDVLNRAHGERFRADLVKMVEEVEPSLARHMAAGRILDDGGAGVGTSLLSRLAFGAKARTTPTGQTRAEKTRERTRTGSARGAADRSAR